MNSDIIPIEVKNGKEYKRHSALTNLLNDNNSTIKKGYVLNNDNLQVENNKIYLPIYMIMFIQNKFEFTDEIFIPDISLLTRVTK